MLGKYKTATVQLLTLGGLGIWSIVDLIMIANQRFTDNKGNKIKSEDKIELNIGILICIIVIIMEIFALFNGLKQIKKSDLFLNKFNIKENSLKNYEMQVFMEYEATEEEIKILKTRLNGIEGIKIIEFVSKEDAYNEMLQRVGQNSEKLNMNPEMFSVSYKITVDNADSLDNISKNIEEADGVKYIKNNYKDRKTLEKTDNTIKFLEIVIGVIVFFRIIYIIGTILACFIIRDNKKNI